LRDPHHGATERDDADGTHARPAVAVGIKKDVGGEISPMFERLGAAVLIL
jgi:hypothetical protein